MVKYLNDCRFHKGDISTQLNALVFTLSFTQPPITEKLLLTKCKMKFGMHYNILLFLWTYYTNLISQLWRLLAAKNAIVPPTCTF